MPAGFRRLLFDLPYAAIAFVASARFLSYSALVICTPAGLPRSLMLTRKVSLAVMAASAAITVMPKAIAPTVTGILAEPGGATVANRGGSRAGMAVPYFSDFAIAQTRVRVGNSSG